MGVESTDMFHDKCGNELQDASEAGRESITSENKPLALHQAISVMWVGAMVALDTLARLET